MGIWAGIVAIFQFLGKALDLSLYWLNPKERKRRRKTKYLHKYNELQGRRDMLFQKGAQEGFTKEIDIEMARIEKEMTELKRFINAME